MCMSLIRNIEINFESCSVHHLRIKCQSESTVKENWSHQLMGSLSKQKPVLVMKNKNTARWLSQ